MLMYVDRYMYMYSLLSAASGRHSVYRDILSDIRTHLSDIRTHLSDIGTFFVNEVFQLLLQFGAKIQEKGHVRTSLYVPRAPM